MKNPFLKLIAAFGGLSLALHVQAQPLNLRLEIPAVVVDPVSRLTIVQAYNDAKNCRVWYYLPGHQKVLSAFRGRTGLTRFQRDGQWHAAYLSTIDMRSSPDVQPAHLIQLKEQIANLLASDPQCRYEKITKENINLFPGQFLPIVVTKLEANNRLFYSDVSPADSTGNSVVPAEGPLTLTYAIDAAFNGWMSEIESLQSESQIGPVEIGYLHYRLTGVTSQLDATLRVSGEMDATFASQVVDKGCETKDNSQGLDLSAVGIGAGGGGAANASVGYTNKTKTCRSELVTWLSGSNLPIHSQWEMNGFKFTDASGKPIYVVSCDDKGHCSSMELENFARNQIWQLWLTQNMDQLMATASKLLLEKVNGRTGKSTVNIDFSTRYSRSFYGEISIGIPVVASNLKLDLTKIKDYNSSIGNCARQAYNDQTTTPDGSIGIFPAAIPRECFSIGNKQ